MLVRHMFYFSEPQRTTILNFAIPNHNRKMCQEKNLPVLSLSYTQSHTVCARNAVY